jgi:c-di-AMP phosphodiesterase-like protein
MSLSRTSISLLNAQYIMNTLLPGGHMYHFSTNLQVEATAAAPKFNRNSPY